MGRLSVVVALLALAGCDEGRSGKGVARREAVLASGPAAPAPADAAPAPPPKRAPRVLCPGPSLGRSLPATRLAQVSTAGAPALPERLAANGRWTWISLWAAWCGPCKEEAPRLFRWQRQLAPRLDLQFVSLDDDKRQLTRELEQQAAIGLRASYWLPEGGAREGWLKGLGLKTEPTLPVQILVGPDAKVRCIIEGAVDEGDYAQVAALVAR